MKQKKTYPPELREEALKLVLAQGTTLVERHHASILIWDRILLWL
ncbi:hypothetical protein [Undibacterium sp. YM2]|nr:hypothetical protein [Undibacterium sp. YM2]